MKRPSVLVTYENGRLSIKDNSGQITLSYMRNIKLRDSFSSPGLYRVTKLKSGGVCVPIIGTGMDIVAANYNDGYGQGICSTFLKHLHIKIKENQHKTIRVKVQKVKEKK